MNLTAIYSASSLGVSSVGDGLALIVAGGTARLIYGQADVNRAMCLTLGAATAPGSGFACLQNLSAPQPFVDLQPGQGFAFQTTGSAIRAFAFDSHSGAMTQTLLDSTGQPGLTQTVTTDQGELIGVETFSILGGASGNLAAVSQWNTEGVKLFALQSSGAMTSTDQIHDTGKSYVASVSDTAAVRLGGHDYLLTLSALENGITSYAVGGAGRATLIDSLGTHDSLAVSGPAALQVVQSGGVTYAVIAATGSSSLSVVRVNDKGCLFLTDHVVDDRNTRFYHTEVLDSFTAQGRSFVVTAGIDAGVTVMELLPDGHLQHFATGVFETGQGMAAVTGIEAAVNGNTLSIFVTDARATGVQQIDMSLATLGGRIAAQHGAAIGTDQDDLIWGSTASDSMHGGAGDDFFFSGGGADVMAGGSGADQFVMGQATNHAVIADYTQHFDQIDLSAWGRVYTAAALTITATATGAVIALNGHDLTVVAGYSLSAGSFVDSDFVF